MALLTDPTLFVEVYLYKFPASLGITTLRMTRVQRPRSLPGAFYQPRIISVSKIKRAATDPDGNYSVGSCTLTINDEDGAIGALLGDDASTGYFAQREVAVWIISREGQAAGLTPANCAPIHRGWISDSQKSRRTVTITSSDVLGSQMSGFNLDKKVLQVQVKNLTEAARPENKEKYLGIAIGEYSDRGATDVDGNEARKGLWPVTEICEVDITATSAPPVPTFASPPVITQYGAVGSTGQKKRYYAVSLITGLGETGLSNIVEIDGSSTLDFSNYNWIAGTYDNGGSSPFNRVRVWVSDSPDYSSFHLWLDEADYFLPSGSFGYANGAKLVSVSPMPTGGTPSVSRYELDDPKEMMPQGSSGGTAQTNSNIFSIMGICLGYGYDLLNVLGSNLADGTEPKRVILPDADYGVTTIRPADPQWPFPNPWIELNGIIFFGFLQRGPVLNAHRDGSVTMAVNFCGPDMASGSPGTLVSQAWRQMQFFLNEYCLKNKGTGWRNQTYGTLETYANGDAILMTSSFEACQNISINWIGGLGYEGQLYVVDPEETFRDVIRKFCLTFGARFTSTRFGQIKAILVNTIDDGIQGRHLRERIEIKRSEEPLLAHDQVINQFTWNFFYDQDAQAYKGIAIITQNLESIAAHVPGGVVGGTDKRGLRPATRDLAYTNYEGVAVDSINRELTRRAKRTRYPVETVGMMGLDYEVGDRVRITDSQQVGTGGDIATRCIILEHETNIDDQEVTLTLQVVVTPLGILLTESMHVSSSVQTSNLASNEFVHISEFLSVRLNPQPITVPNEALRLGEAVTAVLV